jgi:hypothetical protein
MDIFEAWLPVEIHQDMAIGGGFAIGRGSDGWVFGPLLFRTQDRARTKGFHLEALRIAELKQITGDVSRDRIRRRALRPSLACSLSDWRDSLQQNYQ